MKKITRIFNDKSFVYPFLISIFIVSVVMYVIIFFFQQNYVKDEMLNNSYNENNLAALNAKIFVDEKIQHYNAELIVFSNTIEDLDYTQQEIQVFMQNFIETKSSLYRIEILDSNKKVLDVHPSNELLIGMDRSLESFLLDVELHEIYWTRPYIPHLDEKLVTTVVTKTSSYYFIWYIELDFFDALYNEISDSLVNKELTITDGYGIMLFSHDSANVDSRIRLDEFDELKINSEETVIGEFDEIRSVISTYISDETGWYIFVFEPYNRALQTLIRVKTIFITVGVSIIGLLILIQLLTYMIVSKNLKYLMLKIEDYKDDKLYGDIPLNSFKEFNNIRYAFNEMFNVINTTQTRLEELAYKDSLTGLYSRNYIEKIFMKGVTNDFSFFAIYININRFKAINETFGFNFGNEILISIAKRINLFCKDFSCIASRHEADKFMIYGENTNPDEIHRRVDELLDILDGDYQVQEVRLKLDISCALVEEKCITLHEFDKLVLSCDVAMAKATELVDERYVKFNVDMLIKFERKLKVEEAINDAFLNDGFVAYLQPIMDINKNEITGFEGLARLDSKKYGIVSPSEFIPLLATAKKLYYLDRTIITQAIKMCSQLNELYGGDFILGINASFETFSRPDFSDFIISLLTETKFKPENLYVEITEESYIGDSKSVTEAIRILRGHGVNFSIDDFGDGYSSLSYISRLDVSCIKISNYFIRGLLKDKTKLKLLSMILNLARELNFKVIIEGVETKEVLEYLREKNITYVQGFYFHKPSEFKKIVGILNNAKMLSK